MTIKYLKILIVLFIFGCSSGDNQNTPQKYLTAASDYYNKAISIYQDTLAKEPGNIKARLELGSLYFERGNYGLVTEVLKGSTEEQAMKLLALSSYRSGDFREALDIFNKISQPDEETLDYLGETCERLNLFTQAVKAYEKIKSTDFKNKAALKIEEIQRISEEIDIRKEDPKVAEIIFSAPDAKLYPQAGALVLLSDEKIKRTVERTQESDFHYLIKVLNERGKENFAETAIEYDSTFERVELVYARTIKPDGKVVYVGSRHLRDVSKYLNFPLYSNARVFIISFPEVANGSVLEYKVRIKRNQLVNSDDFFLGYPVQSYEPVLSAKFTLTFPKDQELKVSVLNEEYNDFGANLDALRQEDKENVNYKWEFKNIPQIIPEPSMPPDPEINPTLLFSTFKDWNEVFKWWQKLSFDKIKSDKAIKDTVKRIVSKNKSDYEKARAIYNFCAKEIRYVAVEYGQAGYEPHAAAEILRNKYGDCKDQAILLVTMLREAGLKAYPVLIPTKQYYNLNTQLPSGLFNHCIAVLYLGNKKIFLDPTAETCSFGDLPSGDQGRGVLVFEDDNFRIENTSFYPAEHNTVRQELKISVNEDGSVSGEKNNFTYGVYDQKQRFWLLYTQPEIIKDMLQATAQGISIGARIKDYSISNLHDLNSSVILRYKFIGPEYFTKAGLLRILPQLSGFDISANIKEKRRYPIDLGLSDTKEFVFEIAFPDNFVVKYLPESMKFDSPWLSFDLSYSAVKNKIYFSQKIITKKNVISRQEYDSFKRFSEDLARSIKQRIVLERRD